MSADALLAAHAAVHARLEDEMYAALAALVRLDLDAAKTALDHFAAILDEHMAWEDRVILPAYAPLAPKDGPGRADHVAGDHVILVRNLAQARADVDAVEPALRPVLAMLPSLYRVLSVLEHHTLREQKNVYPAVAGAFDARALDDAVAVLNTLARTADAP